MPLTIGNGITIGSGLNFNIIYGDSSGPIPIEYLVVAGGGAGGHGASGGARGGGGGAGGFLTGSTFFSLSNTYTITVGAGGVAGYPNEPNNGANSSITGTGFSTLLSYGGGAGGSYNGSDIRLAKNGGSGGGALAGVGLQNNTIGKGVYPGSTFINAARQGYDGGSNPDIGGGGGGSAEPGNTDGTGQGGDGTESSISGVATYYAGGGGGANSNSGGLGGGGNGSSPAGTGVTGTQNTGGAGGGGGAGGVGGSGGSGIVIVRYPDSYAAASSTTGSPTVTVSGGYRIYTFTSSGSITV